MNERSGEALVGRYEAAFSVFLGAMAFLWRGEDWADTGLLSLFGLLMALNLAAGRALRRWPSRGWLAAAITLANCAVVAAVVARSGGGQSQFWVLYLLPIFSSCLLLNGRETGLVCAGAVVFNAAGSVPQSGIWGADELFSLSLKTAVLILSAAITLRLALQERAARGKLHREREAIKEKAGLAEAGLLSAGAAHDIGNALTVILGFTDVALGAQGVPEDVRRDLTSIRRSTILARGLSAGLLGLSRAGEKEELPLDELVCETLQLAGQSIKRARVELRLEPAAESARVFAQRGALQRLLLNLVSNALKAVPEGSGVIRVSTSRRGAQACVVVEDNGPGLPAAVVAALFTPFVRGGEPRGHGLGLYLCAQAARDNGGELRGENAAAGGARFTLKLPVVECAVLSR